MSKQNPGNLDEIFPLQFRLREELRFFRSGDEVIAERVASGKRFSVRRWQYEMLLRFDGKKTFEMAAREVHQFCGGGFSSMGLLNFYRWLYNENLVVCECRSVFELVPDEEEEIVIRKPAPASKAKPVPAQTPELVPLGSAGPPAEAREIPRDTPGENPKVNPVFGGVSSALFSSAESADAPESATAAETPITPFPAEVSRSSSTEESPFPGLPQLRELPRPRKPKSRVVHDLFEEMKASPIPARVWGNKALRISAAVLFCLAVLRIAWVAAPLFEPAVGRAYASVEKFFYGDLDPEGIQVASNRPAESPVREVELAGRVDPAIAGATTEAPLPGDTSAVAEPAPEPKVAKRAPAAPPVPVAAQLEKIERLRQELAECRIRRDEFYLQNDEPGYRREVEKMTNLVRKIGEVEAEL